MKNNKDIARYIKKWYEEFEKLDEAQCDNALERKEFRQYIYAGDLEVVEKIAHLLKSGKYENSGYTFTECDPIVYFCYNVIKSSLNKEIGFSEKKKVESCKLVLPYLYENMEADPNLTAGMVTKLENQLDEIHLDKKCLRNAKKAVAAEEETL